MVKVIMIVVAFAVGIETSAAQGLGSVLRSIVKGRAGELLLWSNPKEMESDEYIEQYFTKVANIKGAASEEAYHIRCHNGHCLVEYTSERAGRIAYRHFASMVRNEQRGVFKKRSVVTIPSCYIVEWNDNPQSEVCIYTPDSKADGGALRQKIADVAKGWNASVVIKLVDSLNWRVSSPLMRDHFTPIESDSYYAFDELNDLATFAQGVGMGLVLELNLCDNQLFETATGHAVESLVGERIIIMTVEDMLQKISVAKIRLILPQSRYTDKISGFKNSRFELILR